MCGAPPEELRPRMYSRNEAAISSSQRHVEFKMNPTTPPHILLVDDEPSVCSALSRALLHISAQHPSPMASSVTVAHDTEGALDLLCAAPAEQAGRDDENSEQPRTAGPGAAGAPRSGYDIVMVDMCLGAESGLDLLGRLKEGAAPGLRIASNNGALPQAEAFESMGLLLLTGKATAQQMAEAVRLGVDDLLLKPVTLLTLREAVARCHVRLLQRRWQIAQLREFADELLRLRERSDENSRSLANLQSAVLEALMAALATREPGSIAHAIRVQTYTSFFARALNYPDTLRPQLEHAALLHDIGKIGLADQLLFRPDALAPAQLERMHPHALLGQQILEHIGFLRPAALIVRHHHEQFNGLGYPDGLAGGMIPLGARIFAMMDALDALTTDRPYRPAGTFQQAREEILRCAGQQFDPRLCEQFALIPVITWQQISQQVFQRMRSRETTFCADRLALDHQSIEQTASASA